MSRRAPIALALLVTSGCSDFAPPSALSKEQIIAVRARPAAVAPGSEAVLDALIAGPGGAVAGVELVWRLAGDSGDAAIDPGGVLAVSGDAAESVVVVELVATTPSGIELTAFKSVAIGGAERANPVLTRFEIGGRSALDAADPGEPLAPEQAVELVAETDRPEVQAISWFSTIGAIELYRDNPSELIAPPGPASGTVFAVARDDQGGVTWASAPVVVGQLIP